MFIAIVTGIALMSTSPGVPHRIEVRVRDITTAAECTKAAAGVVELLKANSGGQISKLVADCRPQ